MNDTRTGQILLVNDDEISRYATGRILRMAGFDVMEAATGSQALELVASLPDLVLLDVKLPDVDGFEVCRRIKASVETVHIPVLHISATFMDSGSKIEGLESGADGYLTYPLEPPVLIATIRAHLRIRQVEAQRRELAMLLEGATDAIVTLDPELRVRSWNRGAEAVYGWTSERAVGCDFHALVSPSPPGEEIEAILAALNAQGHWDGELQHQHKDGSVVTVFSSLTLVRAEKEGVAKIVAINRDVSDQRRAEAERERLMDELESLNRNLERRVVQRTQELTDANIALKSHTDELEALAYSISHDLRAPLRGVNGFSQVLLEDYADRLDEQAQVYLRRISAGAQLMGELIDHILKLSRLSRHNVKPRPVDMGALAQDIMQRLRAEAPDRTLHFVVQDDLVAVGDEDLLRTMLRHLLDNAVKFTAPREVAEIEFGADRADGKLEFFVKDNGVGFNMEYSERLFPAFQKLHSPEEYPGAGVGLATVRRIVHLHGGRIWANSIPDQGAVFRFALGASAEPRAEPS